jgi:UPF0755 protein
MVKRGVVVFFLLVCLLVVLVAVVWQFFAILHQVEQVYGPPHSNLSRVSAWNYAVRLYLNQVALVQPLDSFAEMQRFEVYEGESAAKVAARLEQDGIIQDAESMRIYMIYAGLDTRIQVGTYQIGAGQTCIQIAQELVKPTQDEVQFNILAGWRVEEIAAALPTSGLDISPQAFITAVYDPSTLAVLGEMQGMVTLEGVLYPGEYTFSREADKGEVINAFLQRFDQSVTPDLIQTFAVQGLDLQQAITAASIIQREAVVSDEMPMIASVLYNRLRIGMKLEMDSTVQYAVGYDFIEKTWWDTGLTLEDLQTPSPYNTYLHGGLPPGPICNPGLDALMAMAYPEDSDYLYFRARCDESGLHNFSVTYEEHVLNACP